VGDTSEYSNMDTHYWNYHGSRPGPSRSRYREPQLHGLRSYYSGSIPSSQSQSVASSQHPESRTHLSVPTMSGSPSPPRSSLVNQDDWYPIEPSQKKIFKILYIPDPSRQASQKDAECDLGWTSRQIPDRQYEAVKHLNGFVYRMSATKKMVKVLICEWVSGISLLRSVADIHYILQLWMALQMGDYDNLSTFEVHYITWEMFRDVVLHPENARFEWNNFADMDCIIGGIDYTIDHR